MAHVQSVTDVSKEESELNSGGQNGAIESRNGTGSCAVIGPPSFVFGENMESRVLKRPAEEQLDRNAAEEEEDESEERKEEPGEFPKAPAAVMAQRPILFVGKDKAEKEESKTGFKLNPPTLVHGKAKSAPKTSDAEGDTAASAKPLLRPSPLCHASSHWTTLAADGKQRNPEDGSVEVTSSSSTSSSSGPSNPTESPPKADGGSSAAEAGSTNGKPKTNYFIKLSSSESNRDTGFGVFGNFSKTNAGFGAGQDQNNGTTNENYFLQFAKVDSSSSKEEGGDSPSGLSNSGSSFVFGQNMDERVTSPQMTKDEVPTSTPSKFGTEQSPAVSFNADTPDKESPGKSQGESSGKSLLECASAYEKAKKSSEVTFEEVTSRTGEEDEENVFQAQCKLFVFDAEKHFWQERGRGLLRLNDQVPASEEAPLQSRLVMRTQGSLRVVLNTKIWSGMTIEKATLKNIRLSARDGESDSIKVFLVAASPKDAEQIYRAIEYRVQELKYAEQKEAEKAKEGDVQGQGDEIEGQTSPQDQAGEEGADKDTENMTSVPGLSVDSSDSVSQSNSALTDRSTPEPIDPRIEGSPQTPPASN